MTKASAKIERKSAELLAFDSYLRTGQRRIFDPETGSDESKFNPFHDPENGRFTFAAGGARLASNSSNSFRRSNVPSRARAAAAEPATKPRPKAAPKPAARRKVETIGALSAKYESRAGGNPGEVSNPTGDRGGVSYGNHQLATNTGTLREFLASPEAGPWAREFQGLRPGTAPFSAKWKEVAAREPKAFGDAQDAYVSRTHYDVAARKIEAATGYDLGKASGALRQVIYSTAVQHGATGGPRVIAEAMRRTDTKLRRTDPSYEPLLIGAIYDRRTEIYRATSEHYQWKAEQLIKAGRVGDAADARKRAQNARNVVNNRYPKERLDALRLLSAERNSRPKR